MDLKPPASTALSVAVLATLAVAGSMAAAPLVLIWAAATQTPWRDLGFVKPKHWWLDLVAGIVAGVVLKLLLKAVLLPLLGVPARNAAYQYLVGNAAALPGILLLVVVEGGIAEEIVWRGFLFERLRGLLGASIVAQVLTVTLTSVLFALAHLHDQGWPGVIQATFTGFSFGFAYARLRRIWPIMAAHAAYDVAAVIIIYLNLEEPLAHFLVWH